MDFSYSEAQEDVRRLARQILEDLSTHERLVAVEKSEEGIDRALWSELGKSQLLGVALPEAHGGSDMGFTTLALLLEEIGRVVAAVPAIPTLVMGALPIARFGSEGQRQRWLPRVASGETLLSGALHEEGGQDPAQPAALAQPQDDGWRLSGHKICVPAAHVAERVVVPARTQDGAVGLFLLDPGAEGVSLGSQEVTHHERQHELRLDAARVGADDVLVPPQADAAAARWLALHSAAAYCALQLGISDRALEMTAHYGGERRQFDRPIGSFQAFHMRAGDAFIDAQSMRLTTLQAVWRLEQELPAEDAVAVAKYWAAEGGHRVGYATQHLHGGIGIDVDYPLHRYYLWAKAVELTLGAAPIQLERIGLRLAEEPAPATA